MKNTVALVALALTLSAGSARAEQAELRLSRNNTITSLAMMVVEGEKLIEKHAASAGIPDLKVNWIAFSGPANSVDALLSGNIDIISTGATAQITLWAKSKGTFNVKGIASQSSTPVYLVTRNPKLKSVRDFTDNDRIAMPAIKVSFHAMILQMAAAKEWGSADAAKLDHLAVTMAPADAMAALLSGKGEIDTDFASAPFAQIELAQPGMHLVTDSTQVMGGPLSGLTVSTTAKFHDNNPKLYRAFLAALKEACELIRNDNERATDIYIRVSGDKRSSREMLVQILKNPENIYDIVPNGTMKFATFMQEAGLVNVKPDSWKDLFFPEIHDLPGS